MWKVGEQNNVAEIRFDVIVNGKKVLANGQAFIKAKQSRL